jgi:hypothetical protein
MVVLSDFVFFSLQATASVFLAGIHNKCLCSFFVCLQPNAYLLSLNACVVVVCMGYAPLLMQLPCLVPIPR